MTDYPLPLTGIRVLEFTHAIMGPSCGLVLADLGAEVIRIEPAPQGDETRRLKGFGTGYFTFFNRNKLSLAVNLKTDKGQEIVYKLISTADALVENFAPGTMDRLGLGYAALSKVNPALVYCSLKGFLNGPYEKRTALDEVVQMMSGLAYMTGPPGQPLRAGASVVDILGGTFGALAVVVALYQRQTTGRGQLVQNGLFETAAYMMGQHMAYAAIAQEPIPPMPARVSAWAVYHIFKTADGKVVFIGITSDKHWQQFCQAAGRSDLSEDTSLATNNARIEQRERLLPELRAHFGKMTQSAVIRLCEQAAIPFAPITRPEDLFDDPHLNSGDGLLLTDLPEGGQAKLPRLPIMLDSNAVGLRLQPPQVGEHSVLLLHELGYSDNEIASLTGTNIITAGDKITHGL